ncbi:hypothetical protein QUV83_16255 [Cellulomonas cellasea]|uniref:hypothetical protein n=1 Tax=Cellulomonas cellasea TaxID=43670 RepID=UPI0025A39921|nr:hypothetical protein [Cellulomonas cellasea]MDM8086328.1 hypothetical protein [Cellulomonas cellasea]
MASAATPGPWSHEGAPNGFSPMVVGDDMVVAETFDKPHLSDARHIALWSPPVALAVADWLDGEAVVIDGMGPFVNLLNAAITNQSGPIGTLTLGRTEDGEIKMHAESTPAALRLADLILGGAA